MKTNLHLGAGRHLFAHARAQRKHPTKAELILWEKLKGNQTGYKYRRQHPLGNYVVDFYCHPLKHVIEVDGPIHGEPMNALEDESKDISLEEYGYVVSRFTNDQVLFHLDAVMEQIHSTHDLIRNKLFVRNNQ